jgi:hypothetical protein
MWFKARFRTMQAYASDELPGIPPRLTAASAEASAAFRQRQKKLSRVT